VSKSSEVPEPETKGSGSGRQAVDRTLLLLRCVGEASGGISLSELCQMANLNRTTVWRLASALEDHGFIERDPATKRYRLGLAATALSARALANDESLVAICRPDMVQLLHRTSESVLLAVPRHGGSMTVAQLDSPHAVRLKPYLRSVDPLHCSSTGKVLLSAMPDDEVSAVLGAALERRTAETVTDPAAIRAELAMTRSRGFAMVCAELADNENGISTGIYQQERVVAVLNVSGPSFRFTKDVMLQLAPELTERAAALSMRLSNFGRAI